jgi:intein/homing endonuclease
VPELEIDGLAEVTAVRECPPIAEGEGRVVTGRFVTREAVNVITVRLANGAEIRATDVHPVWSVDREEWIPAGELEPGEKVDTLAGPVAVANVERLESRVDVHNIEVHGEHVFRVTADGVLVHNACPGILPDRLPGGPTTGIFDQSIWLVSGGPRSKVFGDLAKYSKEALVAMRHVEGHAVAEMISRGLNEGSLVINYSSGPCKFCREGIPELLRDGQKLWVAFEQGVGFFTTQGWNIVK